MSASFELQKAVYTSLDAALAVPVFDRIPDQTDPPYVQIGDVTEVPWDTDDSFGRECTLTIHTWSTYRGRKEVKELMDQIKQELHHQPLTVVGEVVVLMVLELTEIMMDSDGVTLHGVQRFRVIMEGT